MSRLFGVSTLIAAGAIGMALSASHAASQAAGQTAGPATAASVLARPTYTASQAARGEAIYKANCAECHGANLDDGQFAAALKGQAFHQHWGGGGLDAPWEFMTTQMPPTTPGSLPPQSYADVLAYILSQNDVPNSPTELPADDEALKHMAAPK